MDNTIIIILGIILLCLVILNYVTTIQYSAIKLRAKTTETAFGYCPDGVNSKINYYGTNCPTYKP